MGEGTFRPLGSCTLAAMLNFCERVRCISLYFCGVNAVPWWDAHARQLLWIFSRRWQLSSVKSPQARMLTSSTNPSPVTQPVLCVQCSTRSVLKNRKRIGDMGDPCGIPVDTR